jgi:hypothetical protein
VLLWTNIYPLLISRLCRHRHLWFVTNPDDLATGDAFRFHHIGSPYKYTMKSDRMFTSIRIVVYFLPLLYTINFEFIGNDFQFTDLILKAFEA